MLELATGAFLILHGLVHLGYLSPKPEDPRYPFTPERAWLVSAAHVDVVAAKGIFTTVAALAVLSYTLAGIGVVLDAGWWPALAVTGSVASLIVLVLGFHPWLVLGVAIDVAIIAGVSASWPAELFR
jgi:hypothetical protein